MTVLTAILPLVSRSSSITHGLYKLAARAKFANHVFETARSLNSLGLIIKQVGTVVKEDDRIPSAEALETLEDVLDQYATSLTEIERLFPGLVDIREHRKAHVEHYAGLTLDAAAVARLQYLLCHLASLRATLAVMLQTLNTAQSSMWARVRPTVSPAQCATAVENEKQQLEALIIDQQMTILLASKLYATSRSDAKLLMERDSSQSLVPVGIDPLQPSSLFKYQDKFLATLDIHDSSEEQWLPAVCGVSKSQVERLLDRWSRLRQFEDKLQDEERQARAQKRESQQPSVESDSEDDDRSFASQVPQRPGTIQPLFAETQTLPIPIRVEHRPSSPLSPASSFGGSVSSTGNHLPIPMNPMTAPASPRSSFGTLPVDAAAAIDAKDNDDDIDLGIPWILCTKRYYWKYIDSKIQDSNTEAKPSEALLDRNSWVEILASWVCKEAIEEAGYKFHHMKKEVRLGKFETCFCIERALTFKQIERLVERTVEIYRKTADPSPPPPRTTNPRRSSFERRPQPGIASQQPYYDRNRTPVPNTHPPLDKPHTPYPPPPPLDRSLSMPSPIPRYTDTPRASALNPPPSSSNTNHPTNLPYQKYPPPPPPPIHTSPHSLYPPPPVYPQTSLQPPSPQQSSYRHHNLPPPVSQDATRYKDSPRRYYHDSDSLCSDSESTARSRHQGRHQHRSRSRRAEDGGRSRGRDRDRERERERDRGKKDGHGGGAATKAMMGAAGMTALLDLFVGI
ncbi:hypothetical protein DM02DRAFT_631918 [Periconia macrospinosa]|uniref:DUF8035 domain-containing protein n=1 Tax=Periconia macrospinosa TaxID=97972 RepID=A0A2V1DEI9_9PLEO|nr:hypothetical protein DM02DRAFT_631918 [Periconia macrospinosa]